MDVLVSKKAKIRGLQRGISTSNSDSCLRKRLA
jgi:hypothetical protein